MSEIDSKQSYIGSGVLPFSVPPFPTVQVDRVVIQHCSLIAPEGQWTRIKRIRLLAEGATAAGKDTDAVVPHRNRRMRAMWFLVFTAIREEASREPRGAFGSGRKVKGPESGADFGCMNEACRYRIEQHRQVVG